MRTKFILIIFFIFLILSAGFYALKLIMPDYRFGLLMAGNTIMAVLSVIAYEIVRKQMNDRPEAFVRGVYASTFLKLLVCMMSILFYVMLNRENLHKPSLFILFGIYAVYTTVEAILLSKLARQAK